MSIVETYNTFHHSFQNWSTKYAGGVGGSLNSRRGKATWMTDYGDPKPTFTDHVFKRRFSISRFHYYQILNALLHHKPNNWKQRVNGFVFK